MSDDPATVEVGEMQNLTVYESDDGMQVLHIGGDTGEVTIPVPEHMAVPFAETGRRIAESYGLETTDGGGIGGGL